MRSTREAAEKLGTTVPRVLRAARAGRIASVRRGNRTLLPDSSVEQLRRRWGWTPPHEELTREELLVLAALSRRPRGSCSARAIARLAGVSPTTAGNALRRLTERGFVERTRVREVAGSVRDIEIWQIRWVDPPWHRVASHVGRVTLPTREDGRTHDARVPSRLAHLFWNADVRDLTVADHAVLIARRILRSDDPEAVAWMVFNVPPEAIERASRGRGVDRRTSALARVLGRAT